MKTNRFLIIIAAATLLMTSCSKKDSGMLTIINEDGSCSREFSFHPYPASVMVVADAPIENDGLHFGAGWERSWSVVSDSVRHPVPLTQEQWDSLQRVFPKQSVSNEILMHAKRNFQNTTS